jgi:hypothetical protein
MIGVVRLEDLDRLVEPLGRLGYALRGPLARKTTPERRAAGGPRASRHSGPRAQAARPSGCASAGGPP